MATLFELLPVRVWGLGSALPIALANRLEMLAYLLDMLPTEERHRAVDMTYRFFTADGAGEWQRAWRFRMPYRDEMDPINPGNASGENTQLPAGEEKSIRVEIPDGVVAVEARLWYRLTPFVDDASPQSTLLEERRIEL